MGSVANRLWTPADLAERWGCEVSTAMDRVRTKGVPFVWLGRGEARLAGAGQKFVRFRPEAVAAWEAAQEAVWMAVEAARVREGRGEADRPSPVVVAPGWDGKRRLGGKRTAS